MNFFELDNEFQRQQEEIQKEDIINDGLIQDSRSIYDKYAILYNKYSNEIEKRNYTVKLISLREGYNKQAEEIDRRISSNLKTLLWQVDYINETRWKKHFAQQKKESNDNSSNQAILEAIQLVKNWLTTLIRNRKNNNSDCSEELKALKASYKQLYEALDDSKRFTDEHCQKLGLTLMRCKDHSIIKYHIDSLSVIIREIAINNYPDSVAIYDELSSIEKGELLQGMSKTIEDYIQEFAEQKAMYSKKYKTAEYFAYIKAFQHAEGLPHQRGIAKREASKKQKRLKNISDSTLEEIEIQWKAFLKARNKSI
jgi:hypothetical protein